MNKNEITDASESYTIPQGTVVFINPLKSSCVSGKTNFEYKVVNDTKLYRMVDGIGFREKFLHLTLDDDIGSTFPMSLEEFQKDQLRQLQQDWTPKKVDTIVETIEKKADLTPVAIDFHLSILRERVKMLELNFVSLFNDTTESTETRFDVGQILEYSNNQEVFTEYVPVIVMDNYPKLNHDRTNTGRDCYEVYNVYTDQTMFIRHESLRMPHIGDLKWNALREVLGRLKMSRQPLPENPYTHRSYGG